MTKSKDTDIIGIVKEHVERFLTDTIDARALSERDRDYKDHKQWTEAEIARLNARNQNPIVVNRIKPKVDGLIGLVSIRKTDPKAYPRTQKHEQASEAATDALRFVADNNNFNDGTRLDVSDDFFVEGYGGAIVEVKQNGAGEIEVLINHIPWDRIYFDPNSRKRDFSDSRFMGMIQWMGEDEIKEIFPDVDIDELTATDDNANSAETFEDRPRWIDTERNRFRLSFHFWIKDGVWWTCVFNDNVFLSKPQPSPFLDEFGQPTNPIELVGAYIDRDNQRYGEVRGFIDVQDEINHRRSKALHLLSQRQTFGRRGADKDVAKIKRELAKPDGHAEFEGEAFGKDFGVLPTGDMAQGQFDLYSDAKSELDAVSFNAQLAGERSSGDLSGKAIDRLQQAGVIELNGLFTALNNWEKRIYRQVWARVKQFWNEEKWIRVTDDQDNLRWVGLNGEVKAQEWMEEIINDESESLVKRKQVGAAFQFLMGVAQGEDLQSAQLAEDKLNEIISVRNDTSELDVDIILDQSFDTVNIQQEQFQTIAQFGRDSGIDVVELISLSQLRGKDELIEKIEKRREQAAQSAGNLAQIEADDKKADVAVKMTTAAKQQEEAIQKKIENVILVNKPDENPQVSV